jgi:hypothetical protein
MDINRPPNPRRQCSRANATTTNVCPLSVKICIWIFAWAANSRSLLYFLPPPPPSACQAIRQLLLSSTHCRAIDQLLTLLTAPQSNDAPFFLMTFSASQLKKKGA